VSRSNNIQADIDYTSGTLSSQTRYIGFLLIGTFFIFCTSESGILFKMFNSMKNLIFFFAILGCIAILSDLIQYFAGYQCSIKADNSEDKKYDKKWCYYKIRASAFYLKLLSSFSGSIILIYVFIRLAFNE